jgi:hypothetical protein
MSIQFVCICGKHLRAREEMAGRRSMCPACGAPVGIPLLQPTHRGATLGPMSPAERLRSKNSRPSVSTLSFENFSAPVGGAGVKPGPSRKSPRTTRTLDITFDGPIEPALVQQVISRAPAAVPRAAGSGWAQCLIYPIRASLPLCGLALVLGVATGAPFALLPEMELRGSLVGYLVASGFYLLLPALGYASAVLEGALASGLAGDTRHLYWPGRDLAFILRSSVRWFFCLLAGPVFLFVGAFLYWLNCGDMETWDWLILADLITLGVGYGLFAVLAVNARDRLFDANPVRVAEQVERLGYRAPLVVFAAGAIVIGHGMWAISVLDRLRASPTAGCLLLVPCWLSALLLGTALLRLLGNWCQPNRQLEQAS